MSVNTRARAMFGDGTGEQRVAGRDRAERPQDVFLAGAFTR